ncbi:MAG: cytochrome c [Sneathiellales bacterium]|nr:cytochrome c [Sneathiellales bacterium]
MQAKLLKIACTGILGVGLVVGSVPAYSHSGSTGNADADKRIAKMKTLGTNMKAIAQVAKGEVRYSPEIDFKAQEIEAIAKEMKNLFPEGSGGDKTRSKPEIWSDKAGFMKAVVAFETAAAGLTKAASTGDRGAIGKALQATGKTCGGCHKPYRTPKDH